MTTQDALLDVHARLAAHYDLDRWHWRDDSTPYEICLGSILVQHTAWTNVEKALANLYAAGIDSIEKLAGLPDEELAALVRPSGTPAVKARRLHAFAALVLSYGGFEGLFALPVDELRRVLLATPGIGPETADVMLLYAARLPAIVHDAYTARLLRRLGYGPVGERYDTWRAWLDGLLPADAAYRRMHHAAIVVHCKELCRVRPKCGLCPLRDVCKYVAHEK
jgi:endonuclease-3 related protein